MARPSPFVPPVTMTLRPDMSRGSRSFTLSIVTRPVPILRTRIEEAEEPWPTSG